MIRTSVSRTRQPVWNNGQAEVPVQVLGRAKSGQFVIRKPDRTVACVDSDQITFGSLSEERASSRMSESG